MSPSSAAPRPDAAVATASLPPRPRLVLRLGFAGRRDLAAEAEEVLRKQLGEALGTIGRKLAAIAPGIPVEIGQEPKVSAFYAPQCPLLRLVTGLCEGADSVAAGVLAQVKVAADGHDADARCLETELGAVLPFDVESYRASRPRGFRTEFDRQLADCAWVLALDGRYEKPDPDTREAAERRARAYRAQSAFLLRHSDILIAAADPSDAGKAGGTLETVRDALDFELPVVLIHTGNGGIYLIEPEEHLPTVLAQPAPTAWKERLARWVLQITADPDTGLAGGGTPRPQEEESLLAEYFDKPATPPRARTYRRRLWEWFQGRFQSRKGPDPDPALEPFKVYRRRATDLNYHYSGQYRGAFLLNYALAILAVTLAASTLVLLGLRPLAQAHAAHAIPPWPLLAAAALKLVILAFIFRNTRRANREGWNDRAVDYRYLAERLRGMYYLPRAGSHQPPTSAAPLSASRVVRQSAVDWLFDALVRSISPAQMPHAAAVTLRVQDPADSLQVKRLITCDPLETTTTVRDAWIEQQTIYHDRNAATMHALKDRTEGVAELLSRAVIVVVAFDIGVLVVEGMGWLSPQEGRVATLWLVFVSAILPAVVAALSGFRFQSECQRLAERSAVMRVILHGHPKGPPGSSQGRLQLANELADRITAARADPACDPGSWTHDVLRLTERVATDFVDEAAEWSVLYAKELSEPG